MQGMKFLIVGQDGRPVNHGTIVNQVGAEKFLCQFARQPTCCRLVHTDEILGWNLFPNDDGLNAFILSIQAQTGEPEKPVETPPELDVDPKPTQPPKKKAKRKAKKKSNAKPKR